jgi:hypothetical protein
MTMGKEDKRREESGGRFDRREEITTHVTTFPGRAIFSCSFLNDRKKTMMTDEMAIRTRC